MHSPKKTESAVPSNHTDTSLFDETAFRAQSKLKLNHIHERLSRMPEVNDHGEDFVAMAQFGEVLDAVRLALTWASPAEVRALLEGLVKDRIISEAYGKSLSLQRPAHGEAGCKPGLDRMSSPRSDTHQYLNRGQSVEASCQGSPITDPKQTRSEPVSPTDEQTNARSGPEINPLDWIEEHYRSTPDYQHSVGLDDEMTKLLRHAESVQTPASDNERMKRGNLEDEKEWLEQVEEEARRIAVPVWQHWDRGRRMLLPLVPSLTASESTAAGGEAQCCALNMEGETELAVACRTLDLYADKFNCTDLNFTLDTGATDGFSTATTGWELLDASPVEACAATDTSGGIADRLEDGLDGFWEADGTTGATEDLLCLTADAQCGFPGLEEDIGHLLSSCEPAGAHTNAQDNTLYSNRDHSPALRVLENVFKAADGTDTCSGDGIAGFHEDKEEKEMMEPQWSAKMQEVDQDPFVGPNLGNLQGAKMQDSDLDLYAGLDLGDLPDDLTEFLNEDFLGKTIDPDELFSIFGDYLLNCEDQLSNGSDVPLPPELPSEDSLQQEQTGKASNRRKRPRVSRPQQCPDETTPSRPKRRKVAGRPKTNEAQAEPTVDQGADTGTTSPTPSAAEMAGLSTTPPRVLHFHPPIRFITIPDSSGYQVVQALRLSPSVIKLPLPSAAATPTYILVPAASPPCKGQLPPLSPVNGAVAPVQMSSSPPGSLSDTASKAMSPTCTSPVSPSSEMSTCKDSPLPQSPTVFDIPQVVKDHIQEAKAHMSQTCQDMEVGLRLTSHYVEVQVSQRETFRSGKNTSKFLDKEMIVMGDTDRQKSLLRRGQIFDGPNGDKPKRYIVLLGNAGMGKTTLIRKLCLDWSRDCIPQFDFVFLLDGKALTISEATFSLQTLLLNISSFAPPCLDPEAVYAQILAAPKRVLIIFDGFDQLRDYETLLQTQEKDLITSLQKDSKAQTYTVRQLYSAILQRVLLPGCTLLLSTRPRGTATQLLRRADSFLEVCGFTPADIETYLSQYFTDPALRASALDNLKSCSYLHLFCWNPGVCRLVCLVLEQSKSSECLPRTLTGLCHQVLQVKMKEYSKTVQAQAEPETEMSVEETTTQTTCQKKARTTSRAQGNTRTQRARRAKKQEKEEEDDVEEMASVGEEVYRIEERELLSQLSSLAWDGVKANSSVLVPGRTISAKLKAFGHRTGLFLTYDLRTRQVVSSGETKGAGKGSREEMARGTKGDNARKETDAGDDLILLWASPFLQSYLAGVHLSLSRTVTDRNFTLSLPFQSGPKGRRRPQREELELTQRFAVGLLFHKRTELQRLDSCTETAFRDMVSNKQALVTKHLEGLSHGDLSPAQVLESCHYVYEASSTHGDGSRDSGSTRLVAHLATNLPEVLTFHGVPLKPSDVFAVQNILKIGGTEGRRFCLDLEDSGIQISGLRTLVELNNINTYRACIADVITLWEQLQQSGEEELQQGAVSKFKIHPLKATQVCHIEHLAKLVNIHMQKRLSDSSSQFDSILAEGVPAVKDLHKLEFELGPDNGVLALPKLWELLPGLHNLQRLDLENCKIGDKGAEKLADALVSLRFLEILNLSQNCIGDQGVKKLATVLRVLPKLHCLSLYSNEISDVGAESLAAVLPHVTSLTDLDVKYNKLTDVGAQSLGVSLRNCKRMKTLRLWNQCIPYGVFERLQQQDSRILWH